MADLSNPLDQIAVGQEQKEVTVNELFDAHSPAAIFGRRAATSAGLVWGYYGGRYRGIAIAHGTQTLTANQANIYIVAAKATGVVSFSTGTTNWNDATNYDRLYWASTGPTTVTDHDDYREVVSSAGAGVATIDTETIQDIIAALITAGSNISVQYNDGDSPPTFVITGATPVAGLTQEQVEDIIGSLITAGSGITKQYNDGDSPATLVLSASGGSGVATDAIFDAKGDLPVGTGADTAARLAVGTDYFTLVADAAEATGLKWVAGSFIPQNSQSTGYGLVLTDANKHILHPSADTTPRTFTIPANSSVAFPIGTAVTFVNQNAAGVITIAITTDTMRLAGAGTTGSRTLAANGVATALKITATEWIISGGSSLT